MGDGKPVVWWGLWKQIHYLDKRNIITTCQSITTKVEVSSYCYPYQWLSHFPSELSPGSKYRHISCRKLFPAYNELRMNLLQTKKKSIYFGSTQLGSIPQIEIRIVLAGKASSLSCIPLTISHEVNLVSWVMGSQPERAKCLWHLRHLVGLWFPEPLSRIWISRPTLTRISTVWHCHNDQMFLFLGCNKMFKMKFKF